MFFADTFAIASSASLFLASAGLASGCAHVDASAAPAAAVSRASDEPTPRVPDGVFFDLAMAVPSSRVSAPARGVVSVREPVSRDEALLVVRSYFHAFITGDAGAFGSIVFRDARRIESVEAPVLLTSLASRVRGLDYTHVSLESVAAYDEMRMSAYADVPEDQRRVDGAREGDVVCDVPIRIKRALGVRLFGDRVVLVLRRDVHDNALKIAALAEDGAPWL